MCLYVRDLTQQESVRLSRWLRQARSVVTMRRAQVLAFSGQGMRARQIAQQLSMHEEYVRELIRRFNRDGFEGIKPKPRRARGRKLTEEEESMVVETATMPPQAFGRPFNQWSLRKLRDFLLQKKMITPVSHVTIGDVLKRHKITYQRTRTWKRSNDPEFERKKGRSSRSTPKSRPEA